MKSIAIAGLVLAFAGLPATPVQANPMADICQARAASVSGYSGARSGLNLQAGNVRLRLSGSVAVGLVYSSGQGVGRVVAFDGDRGAEQREDRARRKYSRVYDACIRNG